MWCCVYKGFFREARAGLKAEGRSRIAADLERRAGDFPRATQCRDSVPIDVTVRCFSDYPGMAQHPKVLAARHDALTHLDEVPA